MSLKCQATYFALHISILFWFLLTHSFHHPEMLFVLFLHFMVLRNDSSCYPQHCLRSGFKGQICQQDSCRRPKWIRMKHCYKCNICIHKFDHHCVLIDICIGQFNHQYYLLFLFNYLWNTLIFLVYMTSEMKDQVQMNQDGLQHFSIKYYLYGIGLLFIYFNLILTSYLTAHHVYYTSTNTSTWEHHKRDGISYLKNIDQRIAHPFSLGIVRNYVQLFSTDKNEPIHWEEQIRTTF